MSYDHKRRRGHQAKAKAKETRRGRHGTGMTMSNLRRGSCLKRRVRGCCQGGRRRLAEATQEVRGDPRFNSWYRVALQAEHPWWI